MSEKPIRSRASTKFIWRDFLTQAALREAVRCAVNPQPFYVPFASPLISDLIEERHYFCRWRALRPDQFKKTHEDTPYRFYGHFQHIGWHPVSWKACLAPPPSREELIVRALRNRTESAKLAFRRAHPLCMHCEKEPAVETHHAEPNFKEIIASTFAAVTPDDVQSALTGWNWFLDAQFELPRGHPILEVFDRLHNGARLESLCKVCHDGTKGSSKAKLLAVLRRRGMRRSRQCSRRTISMIEICAGSPLRDCGIARKATRPLVQFHGRTKGFDSEEVVCPERQLLRVLEMLVSSRKHRNGHWHHLPHQGPQPARAALRSDSD